MKLELGMLIKTNFSGPYRVQKIERECTCPSYVDSINSANAKPQPPHIHLVLTNPDGTGRFYLGHFCEETLKSLWKTYCGNKKKLDYDWIDILDADRPIQLSLF